MVGGAETALVAEAIIGTVFRDIQPATKVEHVVVTGFIAIEHLPALAVTKLLAEGDLDPRAKVYPGAHARNGEFVRGRLDDDAVCVLLPLDAMDIKRIITQRKRLYRIRRIFSVDSHKAAHGMSFRNERQHLGNHLAFRRIIGVVKVFLVAKAKDALGPGFAQRIPKAAGLAVGFRDKERLAFPIRRAHLPELRAIDIR